MWEQRLCTKAQANISFVFDIVSITFETEPADNKPIIHGIEETVSSVCVCMWVCVYCMSTKVRRVRNVPNISFTKKGTKPNPPI